jgi:hypothetical protein
MLVLMLGACGGDATDGSPSAAQADERELGVRRVCLQNGVAGIGGGSLVRLVTDRGEAGLTVETLNGMRAEIPQRGDGGQPTLCQVRPGAMRICSSGDGDVPYLERLSNAKGGRGEPAGTVARGTAVELWDFVHDGAGKGRALAFVRIDGHARFVPADEVCFAEDYPEVSGTTERLHMQRTWARADAQTQSSQMASTAAAAGTFRVRPPSIIDRIIVHNTEETLATALDFFTSGSRGTSSHVVLDRDGTLYRVVEDQYGAYQAGGSADGMGNYNNSSLGVEVVAYDATKDPSGGAATGLTDAQRTSLVALIRDWMETYHLELDASVLRNRGGDPQYADKEYAAAALSIHRLSKANRGSDCPALLWPNSADGDEAFFRWREETFAAGAR